MTAYIATYVVPLGVAAFLVVAAYQISHWHLRRTVFAEDPREHPYKLSQISVGKIAEYLRDESAWGWATYARLNLRHFVAEFVPSEMRRAGATGQVRFIGTEPNQATSVPIDMAYWRVATFDRDRIWDERNRTFTEILDRSTFSLVAYESGSAPCVDVQKTWPRATHFRKARAHSYVALKKFWWWMRAKVGR